VNDNQIENSEVRDQTETKADDKSVAEAAVKTEAESDTATRTGPKKSSTAPKAAQNAAVSGNATDEVRLSQCVYKNTFARKSLTVHHIQRRLAEWGYTDAISDRDGWYGDLTKDAVAKFQTDHYLVGQGEMNAQTLQNLFSGDNNVTVVIDR
jgi:peptidoglycan hydrolase-like protein with peptidoglycan-binding domain